MTPVSDLAFRTGSGFGTVLTPMVTPFERSGGLNHEAAGDLARWLTRDGWNDGLVVNSTTGEAISTSDEEKAALVETVTEAVSGRAKVIAGAGTGDTRHSIDLAQAAEEAGADGLLVVAPYYSRPSQTGLLRHFTAIADSTALPVMLYDNPKRSGIAIAPETLIAAAEHSQIVAVTDAKGDLASSSWVMKHTGLSYYSGEEALNLPLLSIGAVGFVSAVGHVAADLLRNLERSYTEGRVLEAAAINREMLPVYEGMFRAPAAASVKAALSMRGMPCGSVRLPLVDLNETEREQLCRDLTTTDLSSGRMMSGTQTPMLESRRILDSGLS